MFNADIYFLAHGHQKLTFSKIVLEVNQALKLVERKKVGGMTGSFLKAYNAGNTNYAEKGLYPPSSLGTIKVSFAPDRWDLHISE